VQPHTFFFARCLRPHIFSKVIQQSSLRSLGSPPASTQVKSLSNLFMTVPQQVRAELGSAIAIMTAAIWGEKNSQVEQQMAGTQTLSFAPCVIKTGQLSCSEPSNCRHFNDERGAAGMQQMSE
jgi:hypothetical protein